jgi:hypothetical protein
MADERQTAVNTSPAAAAGRSNNKKRHRGDTDSEEEEEQEPFFLPSASKKAKTTAASNHVDAMKQEIARLRARNKRYRREVEARDSLNRKLKEAVETLEITCAGLYESNDGLENELTQERETNAELVAQIDEMKLQAACIAASNPRPATRNAAGGTRSSPTGSHSATQSTRSTEEPTAPLTLVVPTTRQALVSSKSKAKAHELPTPFSIGPIKRPGTTPIACLESSSHKNDQTSKIEQWNKMYRRLEQHKEKYGTCIVTKKLDAKLYAWTRWQRRKTQEKLLSQGKIDKLKKIGFVFDLEDVEMPRREAVIAEGLVVGIPEKTFLHTQWNDMFYELQRRKNPVGKVVLKTNSSMAQWVTRQRVCVVEGTLDQDRLDKLNEIEFFKVGFIVSEAVCESVAAEATKLRATNTDGLVLGIPEKNKHDSRWNDMFYRLQRYHNSTGTFALVKRNDKSLYSWIFNLKHPKKALTQEKIEKLNEINFPLHE